MPLSQKIDVTRRQLADTVLMVEPTGIRFNPQTARDNFFQRELSGTTPSEIRNRANVEFRRLTAELRENGIQVIVVPAPENVDAPDAVFPNNWISFHEDGTVVLYPMMAENRRLERRREVIELVRMKGYEIGSVADFTDWESSGQFLEGTGSLVLDRVHRVAFASLSERTNELAVNRWCEQMRYKPVQFIARQNVAGIRRPIYHTNVMMSIGETWVVICSDSIDDTSQRKQVLDELASTGRTIIEISERQMSECFAGNLLQLCSRDGQPLTAISQIAFDCLNSAQKHSLSCGGRILTTDIPTIESCGGGSVRCMLAEVFLPRSAFAAPKMSVRDQA